MKASRLSPLGMAGDGLLKNRVRDTTLDLPIFVPIFVMNVESLANHNEVLQLDLCCED